MGIEYKKLQNGSDIRGVAMDGIEGQPVTLTAEAVTNIAKAFVLFLQERTGKSELRLSIGRDSRLSGEKLLKAAAQGITAMGADLADFGLASTPSMFMSTVTKGYEYDGAIMLTASHLPWNRNGMKFFTKNGGLEKSDIASILASASWSYWKTYHLFIDGDTAFYAKNQQKNQQKIELQKAQIEHIGAAVSFQKAHKKGAFQEILDFFETDEILRLNND